MPHIKEFVDKVNEDPIEGFSVDYQYVRFLSPVSVGVSVCLCACRRRAVNP